MERRKFEDSFKEAFDGAELDPSDNVWAGIERELEKAEGSFKQAFYGAEVVPSDNVWTGIELELERAEGDKVRRRLFFYKMVAAASITFAMCVAGIGYYFVNTRTAALNEQLTSTTVTQRPENSSSASVDEATSSSSDKEGVTASEQKVTTNSRDNSKAAREPSTNNPGVDKQTAPSIVDNQRLLLTPAVAPRDAVADNLFAENVASENEVSSATSSLNTLNKYADRGVPAFYSAKDPQLVIPKNDVDPGAALILKLRAEEEMYAAMDKKEKEKTSEKLWTSVGFAAGGFNSVNTGVSPSSSNNAAAFTSSSVPDKQAKASGVSYSVGLNVGTRISKRWSIQGGVNYLTQSSDYTATNVVADNSLQTLKAESINELDKLPQLADAYESSKLTPTVPYSVNNNVKFFSVPVQAGYLLVNKKFGLQLNAGVSTDLFLENTITPEGGSLNVTTQGRGDDSPYRSVNFSGLMGTEFSYRFGTHYRIALNPGLRYPLNSVYKSDVGVQSTPLTFDVGLRFKYIFR
jgi:hypothetical protein